MESQSTEKTPLSSENPPSKKVLIVDDDANLCQLLKDTLEEYSFETEVAETQETALKAMESFQPVLALVDFRLGSITGIELAHSLKKFDPDLPVILMTAYPSLDLAVKAIHSDIYDFVAKPVDNTYLLRSMNKAIEKRLLTEQNKKLIAFLKESNTELDKLSRMKSKFLSIVTHDLRLPLTSIRGYSEMVRTEADLSKEDKDRCFSAIEKSVDRMNGLINNLLDVVSIEAGRLRVEKTPIDYLTVCEELKQTLAPIAEGKKIKLSWTVPPGKLNIMGDASRLLQILNNLISNAFKHVRENGEIQIKVFSSVEKGMLTVLTEVIDDGDGISLEDQSKIFEQFYQVQTAPTRREGLGLGLTISKEIVSAHQGKIGVSSEGPGKGSKFWFTLSNPVS